MGGRSSRAVTLILKDMVPADRIAVIVPQLRNTSAGEVGQPAQHQERQMGSMRPGMGTKLERRRLSV